MREYDRSKIGVERLPEPTKEKMTLAELAEARRRESGRQSSAESDRLLIQAMGSPGLEQPGSTVTVDDLKRNARGSVAHVLEKGDEPMGPPPSQKKTDIKI